MMQLQTRKRSLYQLVCQYDKLPPCKQTEYNKVPRCRSWFLRWLDGENICRAHFSACLGIATLTIEKKDWDGNQKSRKVYHVPLARLRELDMVEEWTRQKTPAAAPDDDD